MRMRIVSCVLGSALLAGPALAQAPSQEDVIKAELEKLHQQAQALQTQLQALQAAKTKVDREVAEKYMRELADICMEAIFKGEPIAIIPLLSKEIRDQYLGNKNDNQLALTNYALGLAPSWKGIEVSSYKITGVAAAPNYEEAIFRGQITGKVKAGDQIGKEKQGTFALQIHKEKDSGRYVIGLVSVSVK